MPQFGYRNGRDFELVAGPGSDPAREIERPFLAPDDDIRIEDYCHLSAGVLRVLRAFLQVPAPDPGFIGRQVGAGQRLRQVAAQADLLTRRRQAGKGQAVLEQDKGDVLIMGPVDAVGKIARRLRDTDGASFA